jgi:AbrB family looped-hinge helix DNA binding protein
MAIVNVSKAKSAKKICRIGQSRQVVIPKALYDRLELEPGDFVEMSVENGELRLRPKRLRDVAEEAHEAFGTVQRFRGEAEIKSGPDKNWKPIRWIEA